MWYTGTLTNVNKILDKINDNAGVPDGGNITWDVPKETAIKGVWSIQVPDKGWNGRELSELLEGIDAEVTVSINFLEDK